MSVAWYGKAGLICTSHLTSSEILLQHVRNHLKNNDEFVPQDLEDDEGTLTEVLLEDFYS